MNAADLDPTDPYAREAQTFPRLSEEMAARLQPTASEERVAAGTLLFQRGQRSVDFFFVLEGKVEVYDRDQDGAPNVFTVLGERQFTGELDLFNDREILVSGRAAADSRVVRVTRADFRRLVSGEPDIGEIILRALILRRVGLIRHAQGGVVLVGPGHGGDTIAPAALPHPQRLPAPGARHRARLRRRPVPRVLLHHAAASCRW